MRTSANNFVMKKKTFACLRFQDIQEITVVINVERSSLTRDQSIDKSKVSPLNKGLGYFALISAFLRNKIKCMRKRF